MRTTMGMQRREWMAAAVLGGLLVLLVITAAATSGVRLRGLPPAVPASGAGSGTVELSPDANRHPGGPAVRDQLQRYFDAINTRDYGAWKTTVVDKRSAQLSEAKWRAAYTSTQDGTIRIDRVDDTPDGNVLVRLRFISTQDVRDAPPDVPASRICWTSTLPMEGTPPRIGVTPGGSSVPTAC